MIYKIISLNGPFLYGIYLLLSRRLLHRHACDETLTASEGDSDTLTADGLSSVHVTQE
jgi:hypothetical protein